MTNARMEAPVREEELQAYVDGVLDTARRGEIERFLAHRPDEMKRVDAYREQKFLMHEAFDAYAVEPLSAPLEQIKTDFVRRSARRNFRRSAARWAAAIAFVSMIGAGGWFGRDHLSPAPASAAASAAFTRLSIGAHALLANETPLPLTQKGTEGGNALVGWLSQRETKKSSTAPDLQAFDLELLGGRIFLFSDRPVVQVIYTNAKQEMLSLYLAAGRDSARQGMFTFIRQDDLATVYWRQHNLDFSLVGKLGREDLLQIAKSVHDQLAAVAPPRNADNDGIVRPGEAMPVPQGVVPPPLTHAAPDGTVRKMPAIFTDKPTKREF